MSIIFNFTLRSVMLDFVMVFINQIAYKYKFIPLVFKAFKNCRKRLGGVVGVIVEKDNTAVFYFTCHPLADTVRGGVFFPVKRIKIRYKSKEFFTRSLKRLQLHNMSQYVEITNGIR